MEQVVKQLDVKGPQMPSLPIALDLQLLRDIVQSKIRELFRTHTNYADLIRDELNEFLREIDAYVDAAYSTSITFKTAPASPADKSATPLQLSEPPGKPRSSPWGISSRPITLTPEPSDEPQNLPSGTLTSPSTSKTPPETPGMPQEAPREMRAPPTSLNKLPETLDGSQNSPLGTSTPPISLMGEYQIAGRSQNSLRKMSTPPTTLTELSNTLYVLSNSASPTKLVEFEIQRESDQRQTKDAQGDNRTNPVIVPYDRVDNFVELPADDLGPRPTFDETFEAKLERIIKHVNRFTKPLQVSEATIGRFRPNNKLDEDGIILVLDIILPKSSETLIASLAIRNPPKSLCHRYAENDAPASMLPFLEYDTASTHLFIACNVDSNSPETVWRESGNNWILVIVDLQKSQKVYVFGDDGGPRAEAEAIAYNIGLFVNNYRKRESVDPVLWSDPEVHPLYPQGMIPDAYNCGIAVISRAETFLYPEKALEVSAKTSTTELSDQLNRLRAVYLGSVFQACDSAAEDAKEELQLLQGSKKRKRLSPSTMQPDIVQVSSGRLKRSNLLSLPPAVLGIRPEPELWEKCLYSAAEASGFSGPRIVKAFRNAPEDQPVHKIVEVLQLICEVANAETLVQLKSVLREPMVPEHSFDEDAREVMKLHRLIKDYGDESFIAQFRRFECLVLYFEWFEGKRLPKQTRMKKNKSSRDNANTFNKRNGVESATKKDCAPDNRDAECHLKDEITTKIATEENKDESKVREELNDNVKAGRILHAFLNPQDSRHARRHVRFLSLLPIYEKRKRSPVLNVVNHEPPKEYGVPIKNIGGKKILKLNQKLANYFGKALFIARPDLQEIEPCYLPRGDGATPPNTIRLMSEKDDVIRNTKPAEMARLFKPDYVTGQ